MPNRYEWVALDINHEGDNLVKALSRLTDDGYEIFQIINITEPGDDCLGFTIVARRPLDEHDAATCPDCLSEPVEDPFAEADTLPVGQTMAQTQVDMDLEFAAVSAKVEPAHKDKQAETDARLIAAAPDLLKTCRETLASLLTRPVLFSAEIDQLEAAIAKATEGGD